RTAAQRRGHRPWRHRDVPRNARAAVQRSEHRKARARAGSGGMTMQLTDEQQNVRDLASRFAREVIRPAAVTADRAQKLPLDVMNKAWELGLTNLALPASLGGNELPCLDQCIVSEELGWGCAGMTTSLLANDLAMT